MSHSLSYCALNYRYKSYQCFTAFSLYIVTVPALIIVFYPLCHFLMHLSLEVFNSIVLSYGTHTFKTNVYYNMWLALGKGTFSRIFSKIELLALQGRVSPQL